MLLKLQFTTDRTIAQILKIVADIINNPAISTQANLATLVATHDTAMGGLTFDSNNSNIWRTGTGKQALTTLTKANYSKPSAVSGTFNFTLEQSIYDANTVKYYNQIYDIVGGATYNAKHILGGTISPAFTTTSESANVFYSKTTTTSGSNFDISGGSSLGNTNSNTGWTSKDISGVLYNPINTNNTIRTAWFFITDNCFLYALSATSQTGYIGFPNGGYYDTVSYYSGPFFSTQYTRYDYFNNSTNNIYPIAYTNFTRNSGFISGADCIYAWNPLSTNTSSSAALRVMNLIQAQASTNTTWPISSYIPVTWGVGTRFSDMTPLNASGAVINGLSAGRDYAAYTPAINTTVGTRYPSTDLKSNGFAMLPLTWRHSYYGNHGGNISNQNGIYLFNGDYFPGDEIMYNNKTYIIINALQTEQGWAALLIGLE